MTDEARIQKERMKQGIAGVFSRSAPTYDHVGPQFFSHFGRRLVELTELLPGWRVLDVAAGRGAVLFPAAERVGETGFVIGIDLAEEMVKRTAEEIIRCGIQNAEIRHMDAEQLDFPDGSFDVVLCGYGLFFFPNLDRALAEFRRVLKPGGRLGVSTWAEDDGRWQWHGDLLKAYRPPNVPGEPDGLSRFGNQAGMETIMREGQFQNIQVIWETAEFAYADEEAWWATQWSHGRRYLLEMMPPDVLARFKEEAFAKMRALNGPDGYRQNFPTLFTLATRSE
jgi:ubiquinone/menaquinone biosynthesis C-methylase UbiE